MRTVEDIFKELASHMVEGLMIHEQLMNCYIFLGTDGYAECHKYHYLEETNGYIKLTEYYSNHHRGILSPGKVDPPDIIPESWYGNKKEGVDNETRRKAIKAAFDEWIRWETSTKKLYENAYAELISLGEAASAIFIGEYVKDVDNELIEAMEAKLCKEAIGYDMVSIVEEQQSLKKFYKKQIKK